jgi:hypothetical protein
LKSKLFRLLKLPFKSPDKGAEPVIYLATSDDVRDKTGRFFLLKREISIIRKAKDEALSQKLWVLSERLTGLS